MAVPLQAKDYGVRTPGGRAIYEADETFHEALDHRGRDFVIEVATGLGPEGTFGALLGWINKPVRGLEYYLGFGIDLAPARNYTAAVRYVANIDGYRPYASLGYDFHETYAIGSYSHNAFTEIGYSWVLHRTYHLTAGLGIRRILYVGIEADSILRQSDADPGLLHEAESDVASWVPMVALRFSRAF